MIVSCSKCARSPYSRDVIVVPVSTPFIPSKNSLIATLSSSVGGSPKPTGGINPIRYVSSVLIASSMRPILLYIATACVIEGLLNSGKSGVTLCGTCVISLISSFRGVVITTSSRFTSSPRPIASLTKYTLLSFLLINSGIVIVQLLFVINVKIYVHPLLLMGG